MKEVSFMECPRSAEWTGIWFKRSPNIYVQNRLQEEWCLANGSEDKFCLIANYGWFENEQDALLFVLRWV